MNSASVRLPGNAAFDRGTAPYLSLVATARNDNHGGNLLHRMQIFVDAWINQCKRHDLSSELILVEWNPPADKPKLAEALRWPLDTGPCTVRIIEVPAELHRRYRHAEALPLYQMIAKNAGIRRARGEYILVTNIDVVFSDELMGFLATRKLQKRRLYRVDRTDVARDVPVDGSIEEQLAYCRSHIIRLCARDGIFTLTPAGLRQHEAVDITRPGSGIAFGEGWYEVERYMVDYFRWIADEAELVLRVPPAGGVLLLDLEAGPGVGAPPHLLQALDGNGAIVAEWVITGRTTLRLNIPAPPSGQEYQVLRLRAPEGGWPVVDDPRVMNFRFFRCDWVDPKALGNEIRPWRETVRSERHTLARLASATARRNFVSLPNTLRKGIRLLRMRGGDIFDAGAEYQIGGGWYHLELTEPERFRWVDSNAELIFRFKDGTTSVALLVEPGPTIWFRPFDLLVRSREGEVLANARIDGMTYVEFALPVSQGKLTSVFLDLENTGSGGGDDMVTPGDPRKLNFRVYGCGRGTRKSQSPAPPDLTGSRSWTTRTVGTRPPDVDWRVELKAHASAIAEMGKQRFPHLYACGDFQLMSREDWADIRGYAELDQFSMHLDSILGYAAHYAGITEEILPAPMRIYHVEHDVGTGWTPEGYKQLAERIAKKGIQSISAGDLAAMVAQMRRLHAPLIFNLDTWGLAECELAETTPSPTLAEPLAR